MSTSAPAPEPYQVVYAERVRRRLLSLADTARERGDGEAFVAALKEFHRRLGIYPQFGDPLTDLKREPGQVWIGTVRPLSTLRRPGRPAPRHGRSASCTPPEGRGRKERVTSPVSRPWD